MTAKLKLTRDIDSFVTFGLPISKMRTVDALLLSGEEAFVELADNEKYAFFFPTQVGDYLVSHMANVDPIAPVGGEFNSTESLLNVAHIDMFNWTPDPADLATKRIYIKALSDMSMSVLIGAQDDQ